MKSPFIATLLYSIAVITNHHNSAVSCQQQVNLHFYELKPYIYYEGNQWKGIFADFMDEMARQNRKCLYDLMGVDPKASLHSLNGYQLTTLLNFTKKYTNRTDFIKHNRQYVKSGRHQNETTIWFPVLGNNELTEPTGSSLEVAFGDALAPVILRESLDLFTRIEMTVERLLGPLLVSGLVIVAGAVILRIMDYNCNPCYSSNSVIKNLGTALWMNIVSFTGVGYGDVTPKSVLAKTGAVVLLMSGLLFSSVFIAILTDIFNSVIVFNKKKIGVLKDSYEEEFLKREFMGNFIMGVHSYPTYDDVLHSVRTRETDTALIRSEVAAFQQDVWNKGHNWQQALTIPSLLDQMSIPTKAVFYGPQGRRDIKKMDCDVNTVRIAVRYANQKHRKLIKVSGSARDHLSVFLTEKAYVIASYIIIMALITLGIMHDLLCWYKRKMKPLTNMEVEAATEREKTKNNNIIQVDREDFISMQIEVRLISTMLQDMLESYENVTPEDEDSIGNIVETQTMPALSRAGSRNVSFRRQHQEHNLNRTGSFPMSSPTRRQVSSVKTQDTNTSYESYSSLTKQPRKATSRTKSWKIPRTSEKPSVQIRRYQTFYKIPNSRTAATLNKPIRTTRIINNNSNNNKVQRGQTFVTPNRAPPAKRDIVKVRRGQSFPARYRQRNPRIDQSDYSNGTIPRTFHSRETKKRPPLYDLSFVRHLDNSGQIGNISLDYGDVNPIFEVENGAVVITEC